MAELAGQLSERVCFQRPTGGRNRAAASSDTWDVAAIRWAAVEPVARSGNASALDADTRHSLRQWRVTLRSGVDLNLDMRMLWREREMRLTGISADPRLADRLIVWAEETGA